MTTIKPYGKISIIERLFNKIKIRKGFIIVGCSLGMNKELGQEGFLN